MLHLQNIVIQLVDNNKINLLLRTTEMKKKITDRVSESFDSVIKRLTHLTEISRVGCG